MISLPSTPLADATRLQPLQNKPAGQLLMHEVYHSIQGESTFAGLPCVFIRTTVCNLRCSWCDTPHAFTQGSLWTVDAVIERVLGFECPLVELTGGEPLLQEEVYPLMSRLADFGKTVLLETSGAVDVGRVDPRAHIIMDLKCPDSGESHRNYWPNLERLKPTDQLKFVIASRRDFDWTVATIREHDLVSRFTVLLSPVFGTLPEVTLATWLLESKLPVRLHLQMHKYIWDPKARGV